MYRRISSLIRAAVVVSVLALALGVVAGCGGGGSSETAERIVQGPGFAVRVPADWTVERQSTGVSVVPEPGSTELVSVSVFRTTKPYRPALFDKAIPELDRTAGDLAKRQDGEVKSSETIEIDGERVRRYQVEYEQNGEKLIEQIVFVFRGRTEYQLLCQWKASDDEPKACKRLVETFTSV